MSHQSTKIGRAVLAAFLVAALFFSTVFAQGITISPDTNVLTLHEGDTLDETLTVTVPAEAAVSIADIYFMADTTGSMYFALTAAQSGASDLLTELIAALPDTDLYFGVGNYKDFPFDPYAFQHQVSLTNDITAILAGINAWSAVGGYDGAEGQFFAFDRLADNVNPTGGSIGWRDNAKKIVVWFGDAPAHDPVCAAQSGLPYDITEVSVTDKLVADQITMLAVSLSSGYPGGLDGDPTIGSGNYSLCTIVDGTEGQATRITAATGGTIVVDVDPTVLVDTIAALVEAQVKIIDNLKLVPMGDIIPFVTSLEPASGYGPINTSTESTWDFEVTFTGIPCGEEDMIYNGTIDVVADGSVEAQKTVEITVPRCLITVGIDIKPGSYPNSINPNLMGVVPVAILGSADFDVTQVDQFSLNFAGLSVRILRNGSPQCTFEEVSASITDLPGAPTGYLDLVCQFKMDINLWAPGDGFATLSGMLTDGTPIQGTDSIRIVP